MALKINDIPPEGITLHIEDRLPSDESGQPAAPFKAAVTIRPGTQRTFHVTGTVSAQVELECSRCLRRFLFPVTEAAMDFDLFPAGSVGSTEHELGRAELDSEFYEGDEIEPTAFIREQIMLALPMVPVHSEGCKGLCPVCGVDRNERTCTCQTEEMPEKDNPFSVLKKIIKPEKE